MKLNITYNGQTISVADGKSLTLKCKDLKARGNITVSAVADDAPIEMQTLTVINSNNESETASFTMPSGYTFGQFIGSEYDTSGGKFTLYAQEFVVYNSYGLRVASDEMSAKVSEDITAKGTFYYAGESATTYQLSGPWVFNSTINRFIGDYDETVPFQNISFTSNGNSFVRIDYEKVGQMGYFVDESNYYQIYSFYTNSWLSGEEYRLVNFGGIPQTVSKDFYEWFTSNATQLNQTLTLLDYVNGQSTYFHMPLGYTFDNFIDSVYDTSGGKFKIAFTNVYYDGKYLRTGGGNLVPYTTGANGAFYINWVIS